MQSPGLTSNRLLNLTFITRWSESSNQYSSCVLPPLIFICSAYLEVFPSSQCPQRSAAASQPAPLVQPCSRGARCHAGSKRLWASSVHPPSCHDLPSMAVSPSFSDPAGGRGKSGDDHATSVRRGPPANDDQT